MKPSMNIVEHFLFRKKYTVYRSGSDPAIKTLKQNCSTELFSRNDPSCCLKPALCLSVPDSAVKFFGYVGTLVAHCRRAEQLILVC